MSDSRALMIGDLLFRTSSSTSSNFNPNNNAPTISNSIAKARRVDSFANLLANRNKSASSTALPNGSSTSATLNTSRSTTTSTTCTSQHKLGASTRPEAAMHLSSCSVCGRAIRSTRDSRACLACKKWAHIECDKEELSSFGAYNCLVCRKSSLAGSNAILHTENANTFLTSAIESDEEEMDFGVRIRSSSSIATSKRTNRQKRQSPSPANIFGIGSSFSGHPSPIAGSSAITAHYSSTGALGSSMDDEMFAGGSAQCGAVDLRCDLSGISSPAATGTTTASSSSARDSPVAHNEAPVSDNDEYHPPSNRRGEQPSRGARSHAKKKPGIPRKAPSSGRGASSSMRTRFGGKPPTTSYAHIVYEERDEKNERGKRGRGANKGNKGGASRGRRSGGRGNKFNSMSFLCATNTSTLVSRKDGDERETIDSNGSGKQRQNDENDYIRTAVVTNANDKFMNSISLCLICGSVGKDVEGTMVTCTSCAQSYHTYCVGMHDKLNSTVLKRGWRCLDCTVCEGCGSGKDESNLLLCDECDISYHTYCLDPPLDRIPHGSWRCKWCAMCSRCNKQVQSGLDLQRLEGLCETCYSLRKCMKCQRLYELGDLLIKCQRCVRWCHGKCEDLLTEEQVENAAENAFRCSLCRPQLSSAYNDYMNMSVIIDNVMVNKSAADHIQQSRRTTSFYGDPAALGLPRSHSYENTDEGELMEELENVVQCMGSGGRGGRGGGRGGGPGRRVLKIGVGGFNVKVPRHRMLAMSTDEEPVNSGGPQEEEMGQGTTLNGKPRIRRPRKPRRPQLEDNYPGPIQESFFGYAAVDSRSLADVVVNEPILGEYTKSTLDCNKTGCELSEQSADALRTEQEQDMLGDIFVGDNIDLDFDNLDFNALIDEADDDEHEDQALEDSMNDGFSATGSSGLITGMCSPSTSIVVGLGDVSCFGMEANVDHSTPQTPAPIKHNGLFHLQMQQDDQRKRQQQLQAKLNLGAAVSAVQRSSSQHSELSAIQEKVNQATERWEEDEPLGDKATKAAVLYSNLRHSDFKTNYPLWSERVKQINKVWRMLDADKRQEYVDMARKNRANSTNKRKTRRNDSSSNLLLQPNTSTMSSSSDVVNANISAIKQAQAAAVLQQSQLQHSTDPTLALEEKFKVPVIPPEATAANCNLHSAAVNDMLANRACVRNGMETAHNQIPMTHQYPLHEANPHISTQHFHQQQEARDAGTLEKHKMLRKQVFDLEQEQQGHEIELAKMRKHKKALITKHRQLLKNQAKLEEMAEHPLPINQEAIEMHKSADATKRDIQQRQKLSEKCKQDLKEQTGRLQEFESKLLLAGPPPGMLSANNVQLALQYRQTSALPVMHPATTNTATPNVFMRSAGLPQSANFLHSTNLMTPTAFPFNGGPRAVVPSQQTAAIPMQIAARLELDQTSQGSDPPTPNSGRTGSSASAAEVVRPGRGRKRKKPLLLEYQPEVRSPVLGNIFYNSLQNSLERDVYDVVDRMIGYVAFGGATNDAVAVRRILYSQAQLLGENSPVQSFDANDPPKAKKKRQSMKKGQSGSEPNEHELILERIKTELDSAAFPKRTLEQYYSFDKYIPHYPDVTSLPDRSGQPFVKGNELGQFSLTFMPDYYAMGIGVESGKKPDNEEKLYPMSMAEICAGVNMAALLSGDDNELADIKLLDSDCDDKSLLGGLIEPLNYHQKPELQFLSLANLSDRSEIQGSCLLLGSCSVDRQPPIAPHRSLFFQKNTDSDQQCKISLVVEGEGATNTDELINQLQIILNSKEPIKLSIETPPESPEKAEEHNGFGPSSSILAPIKMEVNDEDSMFKTAKKESKSISKRCRYCQKQITQSSIEDTMSRLGLTPPDEENSTVSFCSMPCYYKFMVTCKVPLSMELLDRAEKYAGVDDETIEKLRQISADSFAKKIHQGQFNSDHRLDLKTSFIAQTSSLQYPFEDSIKLEDCSESNILELIRQPREQIVRAADLPALVQSLENLNAAIKGEYKWMGHSWMVCDSSLIDSFQRPHDEVRQKCASIHLQVHERNRISDRSDDTRQCSLCGENGDGEQELTGRLLNVDANEWVHVNCALWSSEVHESESGALLNVEAAIRRAKSVDCQLCGNPGATLRCYKLDCRNNEVSFHLGCARRARGYFVRDKTFYCSAHEVRQEAQITRLDALRRIYVQREENQLLAKIFNHSYSTEMMMRVGSLIFHKIGQLLPEQLKNFHNENYIFPIGYRITRIFWSPTNAHERARYECFVDEQNNNPEFCVVFESRELREKSPNTAWSRILNSVMQAREKAGNMLKFFPSQISGDSLFGFLEPAITKMTESLPGVDQLYTYTFKHGGSPLMDLPLAVNPSGCARCEPCFRTLIKHRYKPLVSFTTSIQKKQPAAGCVNNFGAEVMARESRSTRSSSTRFSSMNTRIDQETLKAYKASGFSEEMLNAPYFRCEPGQPTNHQVFSQYRRMMKEWPNNVYLARSKIAGLGLYAKRDIDMNSMIIEYKGEVIRSEVGEVREKRYMSQNRGVYMFRIDDELLIDATLAGGLARYINHSCDPNCSTKILPYNDDKKIIIIANRPIKGGEELTYDYQFELEDTVDKLPCLCGAPNCNKWMN